jgi:hypothetical protein
MNNYQRDIVKTAIPGFKTATYKGKSDRNLRTDHLAPGPHLQSMRKGFSLPTFESLVHGLRHLPSGLDARDLTQCLSWYLGICDSFTPKLDMNVLHTQSLVRALRQPLKPFGPQNLDRNALQEWRTKGCFEESKVEYKKRESHQSNVAEEQLHRSQLHLDLDEDEVKMELTLPVRHILTFPFLALHGVVSEALKLGIEKAEVRQARRKEGELKSVLEARWAARIAASEEVEMADEEQHDDAARVETPSEVVAEEPKKPYRIPKRPRPLDSDQQAPSIPTRPRLLAPAVPRPASSYPHYGGPLSRPWHAPAPSSAYRPSQQGQESVYGRRDLPSIRTDPRRTGTLPNGRSHPHAGPNTYGYNGTRNEYDAYGRR